ncbi:MAG: ABC transporter substrate-binding protein [Gemmatimonadota bacterium]
MTSWNRGLAAVVAASALGLGCAGEGAPSREGSRSRAVEAVSGGTAVVGVARGATTLLPPLAQTSLDAELGGMLYLGLNLAEWGREGLSYSASSPRALADRWSFSADSAALTYHLAVGRRWSDGEPIRAADVVFTYRLLADTSLALPLGSVTDELDSVFVRDDSTVTFQFRRPYPGMLFDTGVGILPEHVFGSGDPRRLREHPALRHPEGGALVVSGPFRVESWAPDDRIVLVRNEQSAVIAHLDRLVFRILPEETTRLAALRAGDLDVAQLVSFRQAARLSAEGVYRIVRIPQRGYDYIAWNPGAVTAFRHRRVRRALSLAIDRRAIIAALEMGEFAEPATGPYGSLFPDLRPDVESASFDPAEARRLLDSAGWEDTDGDGIREKGPEELSFTLTTDAGNERRASAAQIVQAQLARVGVRAEIRLQEFRSLFQRLLARDYEAAMLGWQVGLDPDISPFWADSESPLNVVGYHDPEVSAVIRQARDAASAEEAAIFWRRAAERIATDYPYAFLWYFDLLYAVAPRLHEVRTSVLGLTQGVERWWIPPGARRR